VNRFATRRSLLGTFAYGSAASVFGIPLTTLAQVARGGTVVIGTTQRPNHLNSAVQSGFPTMMPAAQIFASPLQMDAKWQPRPYFAESWSVSEDFRSITLKLRQGAVFHDGKPITAEDVQFSIESVRDNHPFKTMLQPVNGVTIGSSDSVTVRLAEPHPALALAMTTSFLPILPKHIYGSGPDLKVHPRNASPVGSGPFRLVEFRANEHIILERFKDFFLKDFPVLDRLIIRMFKDAASLMIAFERGEVDAYPMMADPRDIQRARKIPGATVVENAAPALGPLNWVAFNTKHPVLSDKRVRQAINFAIDKKFVIESLFNKTHLRATGPIASGSPFYTADVEKYELNLDRANKLLDEAGHKPGANGTRFSLTVDFSAGQPDQRAIAEYLKPALAKVGIEANLRASPDFATWARRIANHQFDITTDSVWNWGDPVIGVHRTWLTSNIRPGVIWSNTQSYSNPKVDQILEAAGKEMDLNKRKALYREFQKIVVDDCPVAFLYEVNWHDGFSSKLTGLPQSPWGMCSPRLDFGLKKA
jgi:peptide/nickel transport system substrate-binding protein